MKTLREIWKMNGEKNSIRSKDEILGPWYLCSSYRFRRKH